MSLDEPLSLFGKFHTSKIEQLQKLIDNVEKCETSGFSDVFPSLSKVVENCYKNGQPIKTLEKLEEHVLNQYKESRKLGSECLQVALVRRLGQSLDSSHCSILLDWNFFDKTEVKLLVWDGKTYICDYTTIEKAINRLFPEAPHIQYACTQCFTEFKNREEWTRHENTQHFQLQAWRCPQPSVIPPSTISPSTTHPTTECSQLFHQREAFEEHLSTVHGCEKTTVGAMVAASVIGRNGQRQTWCGFCRKLVPLQKEGLEAWEERFNHFEEHFQKGQVIGNWLLPSGHKTVGETRDG
ncbi:hypothetical protein AJ79_01441 [Helicocarpus griseus UAMH5409]|uniref:C2H2-type domain-containing protein n=1 Tax=Helicocarpus griseus UAMH5409 TaxID=1447875 RepID=A0A2B7Y8W5_9EURO|nr:hypothetical protein AJ79_01441 [Helicocarpus griseus UAMH5409]